MIKSACSSCFVCGRVTRKEEFVIPKFKSNIKGNDNCPGCYNDDGLANTVSSEFEYASVVDLEFQDTDGRNEIERLPVRVFEKDTYNIAAGEVVNVIGHLHVIRKNDIIRNS